MEVPGLGFMWTLNGGFVRPWGPTPGTSYPRVRVLDRPVHVHPFLVGKSPEPPRSDFVTDQDPAVPVHTDRS